MDLQFDFMGITQDSTAEELIDILGEPNVENQIEGEKSYRYSFNKDKNLLFAYSEKNEILFIGIYYNKEE